MPRWHSVGPRWSLSAVWLNTTSSTTSRPEPCRAFTIAWNSPTCPAGLPSRAAAAGGRRVARVGGEVADGVVAPVVGQSPGGEEGLGHAVVHRQQLDRGDAQLGLVVQLS